MALLAGSLAYQLHGRPRAVQEGIASMFPTRWAVPILRRARGRDPPPEGLFAFPLPPPPHGPLGPASFYSPPVPAGVR
eukprot:14210805-Alexandrium_andersonii.AAC.1